MFPVGGFSGTMFLRAKWVGSEIATGWRFWRVFLFSGQGKRQGWQKISNKSGMAAK